MPVRVGARACDGCAGGDDGGAGTRGRRGVGRDEPLAGAEASAAEALVDVALSFSPLVEAGANGEVYLDLGGLERLHQRLRANTHREDAAGAGTSASSSPAEMPDTETALAQEALGRVARLGMEAAVGVASSKEVALLAARCGGARVIAAGREEEFLNWLPLDLLKLDGGAAPEATAWIWNRRWRDGESGGWASWRGWIFARSAAGSAPARSS